MPQHAQPNETDRAPSIQLETIRITDVNVLPMTADAVLPRRTVLIRGDRIAAITATSTEPAAAGVRTIKGTGRYLMPGLTDMHVHLQPTDRRDVNRRMLDLFLASGVTRVRNMIGSPYILELRDGIARGGVRGPAILTAGPVLDGPGSQWGGSAALVATAGDAERIVAQQKAAGYDFVKIYSRLGAEAYRAVLTAARRHGIQVAGHVPVSVTLSDALDQGQSSVEHLLGYLDAVEADGSPVRGKGGWENRMAAFDHVDDTRVHLVAAATARAGVWNCPTLVAMFKWVPADAARLLLQSDPTRLAPAGIRENWLPWAGLRLNEFGTEDFERVQRARAVYRTLVAALHRAGAAILVGTDTPSPLVVPGISLHEELRQLVDAGFTPLDALRAATSAPAGVSRTPRGIWCSGSRRSRRSAVARVRSAAGCRSRDRYRRRPRRRSMD
jgi:imidazolonepropionase-like amidohydrolase